MRQSSDMSLLLLEAAEKGAKRPDALDTLLSSPAAHEVALRWLCLWSLLAGDIDRAVSAADRLKRVFKDSKVAAAFVWLVQLAERIGRDRTARLVESVLRAGKANIETRLLVEFLLDAGQATLAWSLLPSLGDDPDEASRPLIARTMVAAGRRAYGGVALGARGRVAGWTISLAGRGEALQVILRQKGHRPKNIRLRKLRPGADGASSIVRHRFDQNAHAVAGVPIEFVAAHADQETSLAGSPLRLPEAPTRAVEGEVWSVARGVVKGWAFNPSRPHVPVRILVRDNAGNTVAAVADQPSPVLAQAGIGACAFAAALAPDPRRRSVEVIIEEQGRPLPGSPFVDAAFPIAESVASGRRQARDIPRTLVAPPLVGDDPTARRERKRGGTAGRLSTIVDVIVPVYRGLAETLACLASVSGARTRQSFRLVCVDDDSPEPELSAALRDLAKRKKIDLLVNPQNLGFVASVNRAMALHPHRDAVILNADTLVAPGWLDRLAAAVATDATIGTATALSNNATICSYPRLDQVNPMPSVEELRSIDEACADVGKGAVVDIPTGVGFCLFVRRACWQDVGAFDVGRFGRGYGEENDFCLRARERGWRNVVAGNVYVAHRGGVSFGDTARAAIARAGRVINALYPGYDRFIASWIERDSLAELRREIDLRRFAKVSAQGRALMVTANVTGGTERYIRELAGKLAEAGTETLLLTPSEAKRRDGRSVSLSLLSKNTLPNLHYQVAQDWERLVADLKRMDIRHVHFHNLINHDDAVTTLPARLGCPHDVTIHDYSWICKRINLVDDTGRYCGEPEVARCDTCVQVNGSKDGSVISTLDLRSRSRRLFDSARRILVPSADTGRRMDRYFPGSSFIVENHEHDESGPEAPPARGLAGPLKIAVIGAIGAHKGYEILLACARDAARRALPIEFRVIGYTQDDGSLLRTGHAWITGRFNEDEIDDLVAREACHAAFLPSVWPETWCFALGPVLRAGLFPFVFDIGAMPDRLRRVKTGRLLALGTGPEAINDHFLAFREQPAEAAGRSTRVMSLPGGLRGRAVANNRNVA